MEIKTKASESIYGKEREQAYLKNPDPLQRTTRVLCTHTVGPATKISRISKKGYSLWVVNISFPVYGLPTSASTHTALFRCQRGTVNMRVARNSSHHNILIHDLNAICKDKNKSQFEKHLFFFSDTEAHTGLRTASSSTRATKLTNDGNNPRGPLTAFGGSSPGTWTVCRYEWPHSMLNGEPIFTTKEHCLKV